MHSNEVENHSDPLDIGADIAQRERDNQVALIQAMVKPLPTSDVCLHCGEKTLGGARWCDADCRNDYVEEPAKVGW
jgi:hypothetical protein